MVRSPDKDAPRIRSEFGQKEERKRASTRRASKLYAQQPDFCPTRPPFRERDLFLQAKLSVVHRAPSLTNQPTGRAGRPPAARRRRRSPQRPRRPRIAPPRPPGSGRRYSSGRVRARVPSALPRQARTRRGRHRGSPQRQCVSPRDTTAVFG